MMAVEWSAILSLLKILKDYVEKSQDPKFNEAYMDLQMKIIEIQEDYICLTSENEKLKKSQDQSKKVSFKRPYIYAEEDTEPHCQKCWEKDKQLIHVGNPEDWTGIYGRQCPVCELIHEEKKVPVSSIP